MSSGEVSSLTKSLVAMFDHSCAASERMPLVRMLHPRRIQTLGDLILGTIDMEMTAQVRLRQPASMPFL